VLRTPYLDEAKANVASAQADLAAARINLQRTKVRAPYDGLLREKRADVGQYLNVGAAIGSFAATDRAEIRLPLSDADLAVIELPLSAPVPIRIGVRGHEHQWEGLLVRSEGSLDERTRVMHVVAEITDPYALQQGTAVPPLQFGSFVEAQLPARLPRAAVAVPRLALRGTDQLLVADSGNRLRLRTVQVLRADQHFVYLVAGVEVGERVITTVIETPVEGMGLEVLNRTEPAAP
jgi:RND family efflux transporter MFP subunit